MSLLNTGLVAAPHHTGPPGGVHLSLRSPFGAPQSAKPCYEGGGGQYLLLMDWPVSYSVSLVVLTLFCVHVDTNVVRLQVLVRNKTVEEGFKLS